MIHSIWILSVLYRIPTYLIFEALLPLQHICYYFNQPTPYRWTIRLYIIFIHNKFVLRKKGKTATIHGCSLFILHTPPTIWANVSSSWYTYKEVRALHLYSYYCGLVYHIDIIFRTIQGDFLIVLHFVKRFVWDCSVLTQYSY